MKKLIAGIIIGSALTATTSVFADSIEQFILTKVNYPLIVKGKEYTNAELPVLNYQGNTYVPLKAVGDVLGTTVKWNDQLKRVEIDNNEVGNQGTSISKENDAMSILSLTGYTSVIKIKGDIYLIPGPTDLYVDNEQNYYQNMAAFIGLVSLIGVSGNDYGIDTTNNPYVKGIVGVKDPNKYFKMENRYASINERYTEYTIYNADKSKSYKISTQPNAETGVVKYNGRYYISYKDLFNSLGIKYKTEVDENQKLLIFSFE